VPSAFITSSWELGHSNHFIHVKSCHSCQIMSFMSNHVIHVKSCHSCQIMSFMSNHVIHVKSCPSCHGSLDFTRNSLKSGGRGERGGQICLLRPSACLAEGKNMYPTVALIWPLSSIFLRQVSTYNLFVKFFCSFLCTCCFHSLCLSLFSINPLVALCERRKRGHTLQC
jgi:hypothetical protein